MRLADAVGHAAPSTATALLWFFTQVSPKTRFTESGPWNYANINRKKFDAGGNFNYGATGVALGVSPDILLRMGGVAQVMTGSWKPEYGVPALTGPGYGDDPKGQAEIWSGIQYAQNHCGS